MSGGKTQTQITGSIDIKTTLPEMKNAFVLVTHMKKQDEIKNDAKFAFNDHEVTLASSWKSQGLNIITNFEMVSPTKSLLPIYGVLVMDNNVTTKFLNCSLNWQNKLMSLDYRFEKPHSHIKILTPFEGIEETQFDYTLVAEVERLVLELKANLLRQENWALLSWDTEKEAVGVKFQVLSPITGNYRAIFKHSTVLGHLAEYLIVTQGKDNHEILALKLYGDLFPIQNLDLTAEAVLLGYTASVSIENQQYPTTTTIKAKLNNDFIICKSVVAYENETLSNVKWDVTSNILEKAIEFRYKRDGPNYISQLSLPNGYKFENNLIIEGLAFIENNFKAVTPQGNGLFNYSHRLTDLDFTHLILLRYDEKECNYSFYYNLNEYLNLLVDRVELKISTPWYHDILLDFAITPESIPLNIWRPTLRFIYDDNNPISLTSSVKYEPFNSYLALNMQISERSVLELEVSYDFTERLNKLRFKLQRPSGSHSLVCDFKIQEENGFVLLRASNSTTAILNGFLEYKLENPTFKEVLLSWELLYENLAMKLDAQMALSDWVKVDFEMFGNCLKDLSHVYFGGLIGLSTLPHEGFVKFGRNRKFISIEYDLEEFNREVFILTAQLTSQFAGYKNGYVAFRGESESNKNRLFIIGNYGKENASAEIIYNLNSSVLKTVYTSKFVGSLNLNCTGGAHIINLTSKIDSSVISDKNGSKINATFKSNVPYLKSLDLTITNKNLQNAHELNAKLIQNTNIYTITHSTKNENKNYVLTTLITTPFFGNVSADLNYRANKAKMAATYVTDRLVYIAAAQSEFTNFRGNSIFTIQTPSNNYAGSLDLDITGKNRYVYLTVIFPNKIVNVLEIRLGENLWPHLITKLRVNLPSFKLPIYTLDLSYSYITQTGSLLLEYSKYKVEMRKGESDFLLAIDVPSKTNYVYLNGSYEEAKYLVDCVVADSKAEFVVEIERQGCLKAIVSLEALPFGNVTADVMVDEILNVSLVFGDRSKWDLMVDRQALLAERNVLILNANGGRLMTVWSGGAYSYLFVRYKEDDYNITVSHDANNQAGFVFSKNTNKQIAILGTWGKNGEANAVVILSHSALTKLNVTANFRKNTESYSLNIYVSNGLRYIFKTITYFQIQNTAYTCNIKINTASEYLQTLQYFAYINKTELITNLSIAHHYVTNEYYAFIKPTPNLQMGLKYPCLALDNCELRLMYKPSSFMVQLNGPSKEMKNFTVLAAFIKNNMEKGFKLQVISEHKYLIFNFNLRPTNDAITLFSTINNNVLPVFTTGILNTTYVLYKEILLLLDVDGVESTFNLQMQDKFFSAKLDTVRVKGYMYISRDSYKDFEIDFSMDGHKNRAYLKILLEQNLKNITAILHTNILQINLDASAVVTTTSKHIVVRSDRVVLFDMETLTLRSGRHEEFMYVNLNFAENTCKLNVTYNQETRMFNVTDLKLKNRERLQINARGAFGASAGSLTANVNGDKNYNLFWLFNGGSYEVALQNGKQRFGFLVEMRRPSVFTLKILNGNSNSTLNLLCLPLENGMNFTGSLDVFFGPRFYYLKGKFGYDFKKRVVFEKVHNVESDLSHMKNVVYNSGAFDFSMESNYLSPLLANFQYDINAIDFNNIQTMTIKTFCPACQPSQISAQIPYKNLHFNAKLHHNLKLANITYTKDGVNTNAQLFINTNDNAYNIQLKTKDDNKTIGHALIYLQNVQRKLKGTANINFTIFPFTTSLNIEPNKFKLMLNSPSQKLRNLKLSGSYSSHDFKTEGIWNDAKLNIVGVLKTKQKDECFFTSQFEIGDSIKGILNAKRKKSHYELFGYFPDRTAGVVASVNTTNCGVSIKTPFERLKEISFDGKYNGSWIEMRLMGSALREEFIVAGNLLRKSDNNFVANADCRIINRNINWSLFGIFDVYKRSELKLNDLTAAYTFTKLRSGVAFDSYLFTANENNTLGFVWSADPHYEFYLNNNKISQKVTVQNGLIETIVFSRIPFFNITSAGFLIARDVFSGAIRNKFFYNEYFVDFEHRSSFDAKFKYYLPIVHIRDHLHIETRYETEKLFIKYCNPNETCLELQGKYVNNATTVNLVVIQNDVNIIVAYFAKNLNRIHLEVLKMFLFHLEFVDDYTANFEIFVDYYNNRHVLLGDFKNGEVLLQIATPVLRIQPLVITFNVTKTLNSDKIRFDVKNVDVELMSFVFAFEMLHHAYAVDVDISAYNKTVYSLNVKIVQTEMMEVFARARIFDQKNKMYLVLNKKNPYIFGITMDSPFLPNGGCTLEVLVSKLNKLFVFVGSGYSDLLENGLINPDTHKNYLMFHGFYENSTLNAKAEMRNFHYFKQIDVGLKFLKTRDAAIYNASVAIISELFGNSSIAFTYLSDKTKINTHGHLHSPHFNNFDFTIELPDGFQPKFSLNAFNKTYVLEASYKNLEKRKICLSLTYELLSLKFNGALEIAILPKLSLILQATTRINNLQIAFNKNNNSERSISYLILNNKHYQFIHAILFQTNRKLIDISFTMPQANYSILFELKNSNEKLIKFYVSYPTFGNKEIGFEFGVNPITFTNFAMFSKISLPAFIENFTEGALSVRHRYDEQRNSKSYLLECDARTNQHHLTLTINAADVINWKKFSTLVEVDDREFLIKLESSGTSIGELQARFAVVTPLKVLEQFSLHLNNSEIDGVKYSGGFDYNYEEVFKGVYKMVNYTHLVEVVTPWRVLGGEYRYLNEESELDVNGLVYWDKSVASAQIGGHVYLGGYFAAGVVLPTRVCGMESSYVSNQTDEIIAGRIYWNANDSASLRLAFKNVTTPNLANLQYHTVLDTPFTFLEYSHKMQVVFIKGATVTSRIFFKWDQNTNSQLQLNTLLSSGNVQTKLSSPLLSHNIALNVSMSAPSESLSKLRIELEYSDSPDKRLVFETCYQKTYTNIFATQRKILIQHAASKINYLLDFGTLRTEEFTNGTFKIQYMNYLTNNSEQINAFVTIAHKKLAVWGRIKTHKNDLMLKMKSNTEADLNNFSAMLQMNDKDPLVLTVQYQFRHSSPALTATVSYGNSRSYRMFLGLPTRKEIIASLTHETYHEELVDSLFTAKLNNSQLLWVKLQWKRDVISRFYKVVLAEYSDLKFVIEAIGRELIEVIDDDFGNQLVSDVSYMRTSFGSYAKRETKEFKERYNKFLSDIKDGVRHNAFYSKNIVEFLKVIG